LAVYNGERHLREALDSLLAQNVGDLELVISDNASTDETPAICAEYAARDDRVRYTRNSTNIGAAANFNRVFELCSGKYFMWGSDDDIWDPRFARACIDRLEGAPNAVMCTSQIVFIDEDGRPKPGLRYESIDTDGMAVDARVHELIRRTGWYGIYSVIRPEALRATHLCLPVFGMDVRLQLELLLLGDALAVPEALLRYRVPESDKSLAAYLFEVDPTILADGANLEISEPYGCLARTLLNAIRESALDEATIGRIEKDFVKTLGRKDVRWGRIILSERGLPSEGRIPRSVVRMRIRAALESSGSAKSASPLEQSGGSWQMRDGLRLRMIRRILLRLLKPFGDRQDRLDAEQSASLALLADEVRSLQGRVEGLECMRGTSGKADSE
jgi:glycosyltransferase involved in cell wall biosynthesis